MAEIDQSTERSSEAVQLQVGAREYCPATPWGLGIAKASACSTYSSFQDRMPIGDRIDVVIKRMSLRREMVLKRRIVSLLQVVIK